MATQVTVITGEGSTSYSVSTGARGPTGATGPEATITNSSVNTAIATNPSATRTAAGLVIGTDVAAQGDTRIEPQVKSSSFTASNGETYHVVASATVTDPSPVEGKGFSVLVRNGTATVGGTAYSTAGTIIVRTFHSGGWSNYSYQQASAFDPAGSAAAQIAAAPTLRSTIGFYDDFSRYANGYQIGHMVTTPLINDGLTYRQSFNGSGAGSMFIEDGALRCPVNSNNYLGFSFNTPDAEIEMYFDIEVRRPPGSSETQGGGGFTLTHKESAVVSDPGDINPSGGIHTNLGLSGVSAIDHFQQGTAVNQISTNTGGFLPGAPAVGVRSLVRVWAKGDIYEVTAFGKTVRYQSTAFPGRIGSPKTYFYFQLNITPFAGQPDPSVRCYTVLHRMWGNAKGIKLDNTSEKTSAFDGNVAASYPNKIDIQPATAFVGHGAGQRNETLRVGGAAISGNTYTGGGAYVEGVIRATTIPGWNPGFVALEFPQTFNAVVQSPAPASLATTFRGLHRISNLPTGWRDEGHYAGFLGANGNTKRFQIKEAGGVIFDSGAITQNGGVWELKTYRHSLTGISEAFIFDFWTEATGRKMAYWPINRGSTYTNFSLNVEGTALGDVTLTTVRATVVPAVAN